MTRNEERDLRAMKAAVLAEDYGEVLRILARMLREEMADIARPVHRTVNAPTLSDTIREHGAPPATPRRADAIFPQPKPRKRIKDPNAIHAYCVAYPLCEVLNCGRPPCPEPHHLVSRKMRGDDVPSNLIRLCRVHHSAWHELGGQTWLSRHRTQLTAQARSKVEAALRILEPVAAPGVAQGG